jgi:hypothetical protein
MFAIHGTVGGSHRSRSGDQLHPKDGTGHLVYYFHKYRNLYRFLQQGWEALNQKIKKYYFNNTQRGGHVFGGELKQGHLKPLWLFFSRYNMWRTGHGCAFFRDRKLVGRQQQTEESVTIPEELADPPLF